MNCQMVLAGVGGQGILFSTKLLAETAISRNYNVIGNFEELQCHRFRDSWNESKGRIRHLIFKNW